MTKQPLRTTPPAPMPAGTMFTSEDEARKRAPKPGRGEALVMDEPSPGCFVARVADKPKAPASSKPTTAGNAKPRGASRRSGKAPASVVGVLPTGKGGDA